MTKRKAKLLASFTDTPDQIIHAAFRYYLGRMTIHTCCFAEDLAKAWPYLDERVAGMIRRELGEAFERDDKARADTSIHGGYLTLGHDCDRAAWELVRAAAGTETKGA